MGKIMVPAGNTNPNSCTNFTDAMLAVIKQVMKMATTNTNHTE
jgi:hypothetical protein